MRTITQLVFHTYDVNAGEWRKTYAAAKEWADVELAVRSLDPSQRPELEIIFDLPTGDHDGNLLQIQGGNGHYYLTGTKGDGCWLQFLDNTKSDGGLSSVTTADEGFSPCECYVCSDLDLVLRIVKHFVETNAFLPNVDWETTWISAKDATITSELE